MVVLEATGLTKHFPARRGLFGGERCVDGRLHRAIDRPTVAVLDHVIAGGDLDDHARTANVLDDLDFGRDAAGEPVNLCLQAERGNAVQAGTPKAHRHIPLRHEGPKAVICRVGLRSRSIKER